MFKDEDLCRKALEHAASLTPEQRKAREAKSRESNVGKGVSIGSDDSAPKGSQLFFSGKAPTYSPN